MDAQQAYWMKQYVARGALWVHDDDPRRPHALLTKGGHSNGFFNSELVMEDPVLLDSATNDLVRKLHLCNITLFNTIDRVVGPAMGAITLAHDIARHISLRRKSTCYRSYVVKADVSGIKTMVFEKTRIIPNEKILVCDDVITTGGSTELTIQAVEKAGGYVLPRILAIVNRSGRSEICGKKIIALIDKEMQNWTPDTCPYCKQGSVAIRPKEGENWKRLNATS